MQRFHQSALELLSLLLSALLPAGVSAQASSVAPSLTQGHARNIGLVVSATDASGRPVPDLQATQLSVQVDRHPVTPVTLTPAPRSLVLVVDTINSSLQEMLRTRTALQQFLLGNGARLAQPTSIVIFSDHPLNEAPSQGAQFRKFDKGHLFAERLPLTLDGAELNRRLQQVPIGFSRITATQTSPGQIEQVSLSLKCLAFLADAQAAVPGVKLVVWISPGWPLAFIPTPSRASAFQTVAFFANVLQQARMVLNVLDSEPIASVARHEYWKAFQKTPRTPDEADGNDLALQVLAVQSGGVILGNERSIEANLALCAEQANALFLLTFETPTPTKPQSSPTFRELTLQAVAPGLLLRARPAYITLPGIATSTPTN